MPLPDIGIESASLQKIAALCRELQRARKDDLAFPLSVEVARRFAGLSSKSAAHNALRILQSMGVIECVKRGVPGYSGKATRWRYLLPLSPQE
jgi:hypothetical protein